MRYKIFILIILLTIAGCKTNINNPVATQMTDVSKGKDGILYTFSVANNKLGIFDTLDMSLTALNQTASPETVAVGESLYTWSLTNDSGRIISNSPWVANNSIALLSLNPNQITLLYRLKYTMADIFGSPIVSGTYLLKWNLKNGLSFELSLTLGRSTNEVNDPVGITSPIYPLRVGNKWTYSEKYFQVDGTVMPDSSIITQSIVGETLINGEKWFLFNDNELITLRQDGVYAYYPGIKIAVLKYKFPASNGEQYVSGYQLFTGDSLQLVTFLMTTDSTNEVLSVPDGKFTCFKYIAPLVLFVNGSQINEIDPETIFLSSVGPVKRIFSAGNGKPAYFYELVSTNFQY